MWDKLKKFFSKDPDEESPDNPPPDPKEDKESDSPSRYVCEMRWAGKKTNGEEGDLKWSVSGSTSIMEFAGRKVEIRKTENGRELLLDGEKVPPNSEGGRRLLAEVNRVTAGLEAKMGPCMRHADLLLDRKLPTGNLSELLSQTDFLDNVMNQLFGDPGKEGPEGPTGHWNYCPDCGWTSEFSEDAEIPAETGKCPFCPERETVFMKGPKTAHDFLLSQKKAQG